MSFFTSTLGSGTFNYNSYKLNVSFHSINSSKIQFLWTWFRNFFFYFDIGWLKTKLSSDSLSIRNQNRSWRTLKTSINCRSRRSRTFWRKWRRNLRSKRRTSAKSSRTYNRTREDHLRFSISCLLLNKRGFHMSKIFCGYFEVVNSSCLPHFIPTISHTVVNK